MSKFSRRQDLMCTEEELELYGGKVLLDREVLYVRKSDGSFLILIGDGSSEEITTGLYKDVFPDDESRIKQQVGGGTTQGWTRSAHMH